MSAAVHTLPGGIRKAAILLSLLGETEAAPILRSMPSSDVERIAEEVANLPRVPVELTVQVLEEYTEMMTAQGYMAVGGREVAARLLAKAFGETNANSMMERFSRKSNEREISIDSLRKAEPAHLARILEGEHAQTKALLLGQLDARQASALLMRLEPEVRADCIRRMASMRRFSAEAAVKATNVISRHFTAKSNKAKQSSAADSNLADLMNRLEPAAAREILETIEIAEPALADKIRDLMFTFENFLDVREPDLRELVNLLDKKTLMIAMKGASEDLKSHIYRTMSSRAVDMLKEDSEMIGPVRSKDVAKAQGEMIAIARKLEAEGKIVLRSQGEDEYVL